MYLGSISLVFLGILCPWLLFSSSSSMRLQPHVKTRWLCSLKVFTLFSHNCNRWIQTCFQAWKQMRSSGDPLLEQGDRVFTFWFFFCILSHYLHSGSDGSLKKLFRKPQQFSQEEKNLQNCPSLPPLRKVTSSKTKHY